MKKSGLMALQLGLMLGTLGHTRIKNLEDFEEEFDKVKSPPLRKQCMPLTEEETRVLNSLNGKKKKKYLITLKEKYETNI
jgi:hypothetical protein